MRLVAERHKVSLNAVTYVLRTTKTPRRSLSEASKITFANKKASYSIRRTSSARRRELDLIGAMLYWAEGYKRETASGLDFVNSDCEMAMLFWKFLKSRYVLDNNRLHFSIYHYSDQDLSALTDFWSTYLKVDKCLFKNSYRKENPNTAARKLPYGVLHIRYTDKKLLWDVLSLIKSYKVEFCVDGGAV